MRAYGSILSFWISNKWTMIVCVYQFGPEFASIIWPTADFTRSRTQIRSYLEARDTILHKLHSMLKAPRTTNIPRDVHSTRIPRREKQAKLMIRRHLFDPPQTCPKLELPNMFQPPRFFFLHLSSPQLTRKSRLLVTLPFCSSRLPTSSPGRLLIRHLAPADRAPFLRHLPRAPITAGMGASSPAPVHVAPYANPEQRERWQRGSAHRPRISAGATRQHARSGVRAPCKPSLCRSPPPRLLAPR